jgi:DNA modification methylase
LATPKLHVQAALFEHSLGEQTLGLRMPPADENNALDDPSRAYQQRKWLDLIDHLDLELRSRFEKVLVVQKSLNRQLVSFQANKHRPAFRWYKYKEAFSASLVDFLFSRYDVRTGSVLDPFAGAGTSLFVATEAGLSAEGIEVLPIGREVIGTRLLLKALKPDHLKRLREWVDPSAWNRAGKPVPLRQLRITIGAYPPKTTKLIERYLGALGKEPLEVRQVLRFALLCILESVSFTRKDGQYLRWDYRSGRRQGAKKFDKGTILGFEEAVSSKIKEIVHDIASGSLPSDLFTRGLSEGTVKLMEGSCLRILPTLDPGQYNAIVTSPPYCNRYDYTRTYALELALLGVDEKGISALRQEMLSCTVENREKDLLDLNPNWQIAVSETNNLELLQAILKYLNWSRSVGALNNNGIPRMVRGYFYEMACVIFECARVLRPGAPLFMVNDNVRYAGASISVDLILSHLAERLGFEVESILVLPGGKGNSSQQMGEHGRNVLRKCVYVWRKSSCPTVST